MNKSHRTEVDKLIHSIGLKNNLTDAQVREIVESQFRAIRNIIDNVEIESVADEDLNSIKGNCIIRHIGKLFTTESKIKSIRKRNKK